jgi:hypothetical protein
MKKTVLLLGFLVAVCSVQCQVKEKDKFLVRVMKVARAGTGCLAEVQSDKVRYKLSSDSSGACSMLRAGELYKAYNVVVRKSSDQKDASKDVSELAIENNVDNPDWPNAVFDIESQERR